MVAWPPTHATPRTPRRKGGAYQHKEKEGKARVCVGFFWGLTLPRATSSGGMSALGLDLVSVHITPHGPSCDGRLLSPSSFSTHTALPPTHSPRIHTQEGTPAPHARVMENATVLPLFPPTEDGAARRQVRSPKSLFHPHHPPTPPTPHHHPNHKPDDSSSYVLTPKEKETYLEQGYIRLPGVLTETEVKEIEAVFDAFVEGKMDVPGKDFCDMSQEVGVGLGGWVDGWVDEPWSSALLLHLGLCPFSDLPTHPPTHPPLLLQFGVPFEDWRLVNAMLPREYHPPLQGNVLEKRALSIARQLLGEDMDLDYDQLLMKRPSK